MSTTLCPYCFNVLNTQDGECPSCGSKFVIYEWPEEAYSDKGMHSIIRLSDANGSWTPDNNEFLIGREPGNGGLLLQHPAVSRQHAKVVLRDGGWHVQLLGHGLLVNGEPATEAELQNGDVLQIGPFSLSVAIHYLPDSTINVANGILESPKDRCLKLDSDRIYVGSDLNECHIVISGVAAKHCLIYRQKHTQDWWIADCASTSGTLVNGKPIRNEQLYDGDRISVAGVSMHFQDSSIVIGNDDGNGFSLDLQHGSAIGKENFTILDDVSFHVRRGEFVGILGPSGCGKSSLIQRIVGLSSFDNGTLSINGHPIEQNRNIFQDNMSYIPQHVSLHEDLTVEEEVDCFCRLHATGKFTDCQSASSVLKLVGLDCETKKQIVKLSGGQKRRLAIALELLRNPKMLLLDEPTSGLDPATEKSVMNYLRRVANQGRTVLCSTHIMENLRLFDKVLVLSRGSVVFFGKPEEMMHYFKIASPLELYRRLGNGDIGEQIKFARICAKRFNEFAAKRTYENPEIELPKCTRHYVIKEIGGYIYRHWKEFISFRHSASFLQSGLFLQLLLQPLLIAIVVKWACAQGFCATQELELEGVYVKNLFFFSSVVVFWLGLNSSIREFVRERVPSRCLERLERIRLRSCLVAKISWCTVMCLAQTVVFYLLLKITFINFRVLRTGYQFYKNPLTLTMLCILFLVCITGGFIGLGLSAIFKNENAAIAMLPLIMVPVFFFSHPIVNNDNDGKYINKSIITTLQPEFGDPSGSGTMYNKGAVYMETFNPCHTSYLLMEHLYNKETEKAIRSWQRMVIVLGFWCLLFFILFICFGQWWNEKAWDGR